MSAVITIEQEARSNDLFRRVLHTAPHTQVVVMSIPAGGEIGEEVHEDIDQVLVFVDGRGEADLDGKTRSVGVGDLVVVPAGTRHNFRNVGDGDLKLWTMYGPPDHPDGTVHRTKEEADADEDDVPPGEG